MLEPGGEYQLVLQKTNEVEYVQFMRDLRTKNPFVKVCIYDVGKKLLNDRPPLLVMLIVKELRLYLPIRD